MRVRPLVAFLAPLVGLGFLACGGSDQPAAKVVAPPPASTTIASVDPAASSTTTVPVPAPVVDPDAVAPEDAARVAALTSDANALFEAFLDGNPRLTHDGETLVFSSNRDGLSQLYTADAAKPDAPATRLVTLPDRIGAYAISPDGKDVVFQSDKGADENWSIFQVGIDGSGLVELTTDGTLHRDDPFVVEGAPGKVFYGARKKEEGGMRIYSVDRKAGSTPTLLYTDPGTAFLADVSADGKFGLVIRLASLSEAKVLIVNLDPKIGAAQARTVYPAEGKSANVVDAKFSADGTRAFVSTDAGAEEAWLLAFDTQKLGEPVAKYLETNPKTARIDELDVAKSGDRIALIVDAGNHSQLELLDGKTLKVVASPKLPLGTGSLPRFSDDGKTVVLGWSTPNVPRDLYSVDVKSGAVKLARKETRPTLAKLGEIDAAVTTVKSFDEVMVPLNVYKPKGLAKDKRLPVIVSVHGGPAGSSAVRWSAFVRFFVSHGFIVVEPNVRGSTGFGRKYEQMDDGDKRMDGVRDLEEVGKWVNAQPWADPSKTIVMGGSYGGYMTLMGVTHQPTLWKAGVDLFGIYSWKTFMKSTAGLIHDIFQKEIGKDEDEKFLDSISPESGIDEVVAPLFVYAGKNDPRVPRTESDAIVKNLRARKVPVEYMVADNEGHSLDHKENTVTFLARSTRFLEKQLKLTP